jgi:multimeric flavodoxin WrbA
MKRLLVNASPRGRESNSRLILSWVEQGMALSGAGPIETADLAPSLDFGSLNAKILAADETVIALPLYTDSVPGMVKALIESWDGLPLKGKRVAWIVQSGFPESIQLETTARYLARLSGRLGMVLCGVLVKGGMEGIRIMPDKMTRKIKTAFVEAGRDLARDGRFSPGLAARLAKPRMYGSFALLCYRAIALTGMTNFYWNMMLKKHGAFSRRFDAPYGEAAE